jgi:hypothetical protein
MFGAKLVAIQSRTISRIMRFIGLIIPVAKHKWRFACH